MNEETYAPGTIMLLAGTKRGLFILTSTDRQSWNIRGPMLKNTHVYNAVLDQRGTPRIFAADNGDFWGTFLKYSDDFGDTWQEPVRGVQFAEESGRKLKNIWSIVPDVRENTQTMYVGVDPASLWTSTDRGETWDLNEGLESHTTRERWNPGAGGLCLHSIVPDYSNSDRMWIGISAVGCMRTDDGGQTWTHANRNTRAGFMPDIYPEFGQCIHRLVQHPTEPDVLYQQNHCGVYMSTNSGEDWLDIQSNLPSEFGFPIVLDAHHPETVFTIVEDGYSRANFDNGFTVFRTKNAGKEWESLTNGLPQGSAVRLGVLRHGMCADAFEPCGVYVGTNTGQIFATADSGDSWNLIANFLPSIYSVNVTVIQ